MRCSNPLGNAEDTLYTLLLKSKGTAICASPGHDFTPLTSVCHQWGCQCRQEPGGCHIAASDVLLLWKLLVCSLICLV